MTHRWYTVRDSYIPVVTLERSRHKIVPRARVLSIQTPETTPRLSDVLSSPEPATVYAPSLRVKHLPLYLRRGQRSWG